MAAAAFLAHSGCLSCKTGQRQIDSPDAAQTSPFGTRNPKPNSQSPIKHQDRNAKIPQIVTGNVTNISWSVKEPYCTKVVARKILRHNRSAAEERAFSWHSHLIAKAVMESSNAVTETTPVIQEQAPSRKLCALRPNQEEELHISRRSGKSSRTDCWSEKNRPRSLFRRQAATRFPFDAS